MEELQLKEPGEPRAADEDVTADSVIEADDLVEEVSIDGMCGVY
ncbi:mycofactocin precursor MftA [Streptomyces sp. NPDC088197]|nr:mycofactocin precursor MftA [Streptomyces sp. CBMA29]MBD0735828.1 mycofactocin precursor [Streptomyces sp. CBMA29]